MDALDDHDESVRIAVKALGDMRNGASRPCDSSSSSSDSAFVARMSHIPFVNSALRVYEQGKASSRMVKYGAEMVESSVITISRPVINRLPVDVNQLDEFACRQLDRLDRYRHPSASESQPPIDSSNPDRESGRLKSSSNTKTFDRSALEDDEEQCDGSGEDDKTEVNINTSPPPPLDSHSSTPTRNGDESSRPKTSASQDSDEAQVAQRSRWQAVLLEAGGLSAALSEESMRRLKYCLQWLQYATAYIDAHILFLRNFTANLQPLPSNTAESTRRSPISEEHMRRLIDVRKDIVHTIRQAVDIVSKYAGGALPEPARTRVRGFILTLPQRWASKASAAGGGAAGTAGGSERDSTVTAAASGSGATRRPGGQRRAAHRERGADLRSGASSRAPSPTPSSRVSRRRNGDVGEGGEGSRVSAGTALVTARRILALATESLDMMRNVTGVMKDSLDRAEAWVGRLRTVGIQRDTQEQDADTTSEFEFSQRSLQHHNRGDDPDQDIPSSPFFSATSTVWGSSIPSTPAGDTFTPAYVAATAAGGGGGGGGGGAASPNPGMTIPIGAMSLSSRSKCRILGLTGEEEEEEEEEEVKKDGVVVNMNMKMEEGSGQVRVVDVDDEAGEEEKGLKMDVDV